MNIHLRHHDRGYVVPTLLVL